MNIPRLILMIFLNAVASLKALGIGFSSFKEKLGVVSATKLAYEVTFAYFNEMVLHTSCALSAKIQTISLTSYSPYQPLYFNPLFNNPP